MSHLHVINLFFIFLSLLQIPTNCHICTNIATGHLAQLHFKSFSHTRHHVESDLLLFASDQVYWIDRKTITAINLTLPDQSYGWNSNKSYYSLKGLRTPENSGPVESLYLINNEREKVWQTVLLTEKHQLIYNWKGNLLQQSELENRYSLVLNEWAHGYVLQVMDTGQKPEEVVIYDFHYTPSKAPSKAMTPHLIPQSTSSPYFYLYRAQLPNTFRFIHQAHFEKQQNEPTYRHLGPLFEQSTQIHQPPPGFIHNGLVYLFDSNRGCVYIFEYYPDLQTQLQTVTSFLYPRMSVSFEHFFLCSEQFFLRAGFSENIVKLDSARCQKDPEWNRNSSHKMEHSTDTSTVFQADSSLSWSLTTSAALAFSILFIGILYLVKCREEDPALSESAHWDYEAQETTKRKNGKRKTKQKTRKKRKNRDYSPTNFPE